MKVLKILIVLLFVISCDNLDEVSSDSNQNSSGQGIVNNQNFTVWSIPKSEIYEGSGKDGIPSINNPNFVSTESQIANTFMNADDLVIGVKIGNEVRAYPHKILDWHEIVNDKFGNEKIIINYCPLTRTAFAWKQIVNGEAVDFGVSGLLYNSNLILYDRKTDSNWSQMKLESINGSQIGKKPTTIPIIETNWETWKSMYPNSKVLSDNQGFDRNYQIYPYGGYLEVDNFLFFPVAPLNTTLKIKERVHGIIDNDELKAYRFKEFTEGSVFKDTFMGNDFLLVGNNNVIKSYLIPTDLQNTSFTYSYDKSEEFFTDDLGNSWSIFGEAINGPLKGRKLQEKKSVTGFWFSLSSFYPDPEIFE